MHRCSSWLARAAVLATIAFASSCTRADTDDAGRDTRSDTATPPGSATTDRSPTAMNRAPARDADQEFLRMMSDHHEGLIGMVSAAMSKASTEQARADAHALHTKQQREQTEMVALAASAYADTIVPMTMPGGQAMNDTLQSRSGADYDRTLYRMLIQHHREGVGMIDRFLPRLSRADVRQMAERMRADQQREIAEFERKQSALAGRT